MELDYSNIVLNIYTRIFLKEVDSSINIFLCGASTQSSDSIRDKIYTQIKDDTRFNIVFPEWLFGSLLSKSKYNLLELENLLAENVDVIVIPLEGLGTFAEIGSFASNEKLREKIIVINKIAYRDKSSFINYGPVKLIKKANKHNLIFFEDEFKQLDIDNVIRRIRSLRLKTSKYDLTNIFNLARFIHYLIALFQPVSKEAIKICLDSLKRPYNEDFIFPCLEILMRRNKITKDIKEVKGHFYDLYLLSINGHNYIYENLLSRLSVIRMFCKLRAKILNQYNRKLNLRKIDKKQLVSRLQSNTE